MKSEITERIDVKVCVCTALPEITEIVKQDPENDVVCTPESHMTKQ